MPRPLRTACLLLTFAVSATSALAADFMIDPAQSFLTLTGGYDDRNGIPPQYVPFEEQSPGSLTTYFSGRLLVDNMYQDGRLDFATNAIKATPRLTDVLPHESPASSAWQMTDFLGPAQNVYFAMREQYLSFQGVISPTPALGQYSGDVTMFLNSDQVDVDARPIQLSTEAWGILDPGYGRTASLQVVGDQLELTIPIDFVTSQRVGIQLDVHYAGQVVARLPLNEAPSPEVHNSGFERQLVLPGESRADGWSQYPNDEYGTLNPATTDALQPTEGLHVGYLDVTNGTSYFSKSVVGGALLTPDDMFEVSFDLGNFEMPVGDTPGDDIDELISVQVYFAKSNALTTPIGEIYTLAQLSAIDEGTWWHDQKVLFDASLLSPNGFNNGLELVFQATSTGDDTGRLVFDDIQLRRVPEPATFVLGAFGAATLLVCRARRKQ